jgi:hypothetical protein
MHYRGRTIDTLERNRKRKRFHVVTQVHHALWVLGEQKKASGLLGCGFWFRHYRSKCGTDKLKRLPCNSIFCPDCANRRSIPLQKRIAERINQTYCDYFHLSITVLSWPVLTKEGINRLVKQFKQLRDSEVWKAQVLGGLYAIETTWNAGAGWHPHLHILIEVPKQRGGLLPYEWLESLKSKWHEITGDSKYINVKRMYGIDKKGRKTRKLNRRALREVVKYSTKAATFAAQPELVRQFLDTFKNVRRYQSFGSFMGIAKQAEEDAEKELQPSGCKCGKCPPNQWRLIGIVHECDTRLMADGSRQLRLYDSGTDPPKIEPKDWLSEEQYQREANRMQPLLFQGPLFDGAYEQFN